MLTPSTQLPLYGKRILVTAPRNYATRLSAQIVNQGGLPILMPTIETCWLENYTELDRALGRLDAFEWIAFTSRNGIEAFFDRMKSLALPASALKSCQLCAIGLDAERLSELGVKVDLIPAESSPQGIVAELSRNPQIHGQEILVPVPEVVGIPEPNIVPRFVSGLQQLGMKVTRVPAYTTRSLDKRLYEVEFNLLYEGKIDTIAFSSTAEIESFLQGVSLDKIHDGAVISCFGPHTAANAKALGIEVSIVAKDYRSFEGFVRAMAEFFSGSLT